MNYKKLLITTILVIIVLFGTMLVTSYAWYTFSKGSTSFNTSTYNEYIDINYETSQVINVTTALPIEDDQIETSASSNNFTVSIVNPNNTAEVLLSISLVNITIAKELQNIDFKYQLLRDGEIIKEGTGLDFTSDGSPEENNATYEMSKFEIASKEVIYSGENNDFTFRVWIRNNGSSQNDMQSKTFSASIEVNAVKVRNISE